MQYFLRRIILIAIAVYMIDPLIYQILTIMFLNLFVLILIVQIRAQITPQDRRMEYLNQLLVCYCGILILCFTSWTFTDQQLLAGWILFGLICFILVSNLSFALSAVLQVIRTAFLRFTGQYMLIGHG